MSTAPHPECALTGEFHEPHPIRPGEWCIGIRDPDAKDRYTGGLTARGAAGRRTIEDALWASGLSIGDHTHHDLSLVAWCVLDRLEGLLPEDCFAYTGG